MREVAKMRKRFLSVMGGINAAGPLRFFLPVPLLSKYPRLYRSSAGIRNRRGYFDKRGTGKTNLRGPAAFIPPMTDKKRFRIFATSRIGDPAENRLRERGYELEVFEGPEAPPKKLIIEKVKSGIDGLITTLRDPIDADIFEAGKGSLKVVAQ